MAHAQSGVLSATADIARLPTVCRGTACARVAARAGRVTQDLRIDVGVRRHAVLAEDLRILAGNVGNLRVRRVAAVSDGRRCLIIVEHHGAQLARARCGDRLRDGGKVLHHDPACQRDSRGGNGVDTGTGLPVFRRKAGPALILQISVCVRGIRAWTERGIDLALPASSLRQRIVERRD